MQKKKIVFLVLVFLLVAVYLFRYPLFYRFQIFRLRSLTCKEENCYNRFWVHGVNSIKRLKYLENFQGYELDIIYTGPKGFSVLHPPDIVIGDTLRLETYLEQSDMNLHRFWLDTRFVGPPNMEEALIALNKLANRFPDFKNCTILEVYFLPVAQLLAANGYTVSFNVSQSWLNDLPGNRNLQDSVKNILKDVKYVSQEATYLPKVKQLFPGKKILTWHLTIKDFLDRKPLKALLADPQVEVILVTIKTP